MTSSSSAPLPVTQFISPKLWQWRDLALTLGSAPVLVRDVVQADITSGDADATLIVENAKRGTFTTGAGNDHLTLRALSNSTGVGNLFTVSTGLGNDVVSLTGSGMRSEAVVSLGAGNDLLTLAGMRVARVDDGAGNDIIRTGLDGLYTVEGGGHGGFNLEQQVAIFGEIQSFLRQQGIIQAAQ